MNDQMNQQTDVDQPPVDTCAAANPVRTGPVDDTAGQTITVPLADWTRPGTQECPESSVRVSAQVWVQFDRGLATQYRSLQTLSVVIRRPDYDDTDSWGKSTVLDLDLWQARDLRDAITCAVDELSSRGLLPAADRQPPVDAQNEVLS